MPREYTPEEQEDLDDFYNRLKTEESRLILLKHEVDRVDEVVTELVDAGNDFAITVSDHLYELAREETYEIENEIKYIREDIEAIENKPEREITNATIVVGERGTMKNKVFVLVHDCPNCGALIAIPLEDGEEAPDEGYCSFCHTEFNLTYE